MEKVYRDPPDGRHTRLVRWKGQGARGDHLASPTRMARWPQKALHKVMHARTRAVEGLTILATAPTTIPTISNRGIDTSREGTEMQGMSLLGVEKILEKRERARGAVPIEDGAKVEARAGVNCEVEVEAVVAMVLARGTKALMAGRPRPLRQPLRRRTGSGRTLGRKVVMQRRAVGGRRVKASKEVEAVEKMDVEVEEKGGVGVEGVAPLVIGPPVNVSPGQVLREVIGPAACTCLPRPINMWTIRKRM